MIILIIVISLILTIIMSICYEKCDMFKSDYFETVAAIFGIIFCISAIIAFVLILKYPYAINEKLNMYQEENQNIEEKIKTTIQNYKEYEQETFSKIVEKADLQTLILKFPELNSNELVKSEIETYKSNNDKIKELKEQQIDKGIIGWWLFFNIGG